MKEKRTRNWACIIYPRQTAEDVTECPDNWAEVLEQLGVKAAVSPLHDKDLKEDGTFKKPHRHVLFSFEGVKSEKQVRELFQRIGGVGCEPINSMYAQVRYLTHKDNKDKAQYSALNVLTFGGFEYKRYVSTKEDEERECTAKMVQIFGLMEERCVVDFHHVADLLWSEEPELFGTFRRNSYFFAQYIKSKKDFTSRMAEKGVYLEQDELLGSLHNPHYVNEQQPEEQEQGGTNEKPIPNQEEDAAGGGNAAGV